VIVIRDAGKADLITSYNTLGDRISMSHPRRMEFQGHRRRQPLVISDMRPAAWHIAYDRLGPLISGFEDRTAPTDTYPFVAFIHHMDPDIQTPRRRISHRTFSC
jgi:hypothetical protein